MSASEARIAANRRNSLKSTGPKTAEGKAASRLNAFKHGLAGRGDLAGPEEDLKVIAERAESYARELHAVGSMGQLLAHRVALLSVRLEGVAIGAMVADAAAARAARADFDADRDDAIAELLAEADSAAPDADPAAAQAALAESPDGLAALIVAWRDLIAQLRAADPGDAPARAARRLGLAAEEATPLAPADLAGRGEAEVARLAALAASPALRLAARAIDQDRAEAGHLARFDPSPEVALARRYEAATERGMLRTMAAIAAINRRAGRVAPEAAAADLRATRAMLAMIPTPPAAAPAQATPPPAPPRPAPPLASFGAGVGAPLASFGAGVAPAPIRSTAVDLTAAEPRKPRPDLRKLNQQLAANRR